MAQPFFRGNYGSALGRVDTRPIVEAGRAQGQMFANLGGQIGGMIQQYGLNKQKREEMTNEIESTLKVRPDYLARMTSTGIEADDKKAQTRLDKLAKGELKLSELKGLAGELALMEKQDLREQQEAANKLSERTAILNQLLALENYKGKKREATEADQNKARRDNYFAGLNKDLDEALGLLRNNPNAKLEPKFAKLVANQNMVRNKQGDISFYQTDPTEEELNRVKNEIAKLQYRKAEQDQSISDYALDLKGGVGGVAQALVDKEELEKKQRELDVQKGEFDISAKEQEQKGGKYSTIDQVSAELARLAEKGTTASAVRNKFGGYDIANVQAVRKQNLTEFDPTNHPGIFADMNGSLFKLDKDGELVSIGGDKTAQREGQKLDYLRMRSKQINDNYLFYKQNGELVDRNYVRPDSPPDGNTDPDDLYYKWDGQYLKYNQDEEDLINDVEILTERIGATLDFDLDVTK